jgi:extracellular matrix regulatory protein A
LKGDGVLKKMLNIGYNNTVSTDKIVSILDTDSAPARRLMKNSKDEMMLIDATHGKKALSVIIVESNHVIVSAVDRKTLSKRIDDLCL